MQNEPLLLRVGVGVVISDEQTRVLACLRRAVDYYGGYWEFPGGKCEPGENPAACVVRELREELGITVTTVEPLPLFHHDYPDRNRRVELHPYLCRLLSGPPLPIEVDDFRWCTPAELLRLKFLPANGPLIEAVRRRIEPGST